MNYNTGEVSGFATGGFQGGWNGALALTGSTGLIFDSQEEFSNADYSGKFTGGYVSVPTPIPGLGAGGYATHSSNGVTVVGGSVGGALLGRYAFGATRTNTSRPLDLGKYWAFGPDDWKFYLLRKLCK